MSLRTDFIVTPIEEVFCQGIAAANGLKSSGFEAYPALDYILSSLFLRMTGFSEQKLRSIHWMIATQDLEIRYEMIKGDQGIYGEYSAWDKKKNFYKFMLDEYQKLKGNAISWTDAEKESFVDYTKNIFETTLQDSVFQLAYNSDVNNAIAFVKTWTKDDVLCKGLLDQKITALYPSLYKCRNRSAHNTLSYQRDFLSFSEFMSPQNPLSNYFVYFAILILLDTIFIRTYSKLSEVWPTGSI